MEDDTDRTLSDIHESSPMLVKQIMEIQRHIASREESEVWAERLRFVDISGVITEAGNHSRKRRRSTRNDEYHPFDNHSVRVLPLTDRLPVDRNPYVAISWRWNSDLPLGQGAPRHRYWIQRPKEQPRPSKVPDICFDRAIRFAQAHGIHFIWIDKECIYQENEEDQAAGIQGMDLVYRDCKLSLGLLQVELQSQQQLKALSDLLSLKIIDETSKEPRFKSRVPQRLISRILDVLRLIISDERWERTWIFQEDHCASSNMLLLVRHALSLDKDYKRFGDLPGELQIRCPKFRKAATKFYMACDAVKQPYSHDLFSKVRQYNTWNQGYGLGRDPGPGNRQLNLVSTDSAELPHLAASSLSILRDMKARNNHVVADRLAIFANCCQYLTRLNITNLTRAGYGLSTCLLCLYLLNGAILGTIMETRSSQPSQDSKDILNCSICEFLERFSLVFDPPCEKFRLSFIDKYCGFGRVKLTPYGTETQGRLWEIGEAITLPDSEIEMHDAESESSSSDFDDYALYALLGRLKSLKHYSLEAEFFKYLKTRQRNQFIDKMIETVLKGLIQGKALRLARPIGELNALGIFVCDEKDIRNPEQTMAFTSYSKKNSKIVSIEVQHDGILMNGPKRLYARSWINGVYFAYDRPKGTYLFPWPFAHSYEEVAS